MVVFSKMMDEQAESIRRRIDAKESKDLILISIREVWGLGERRIFPLRASRATCNPTRSEFGEQEMRVSFLDDGIIDELLSPFSHTEELVLAG